MAQNLNRRFRDKIPAALPELPGAMAYRDMRESAVAIVQAMAFLIAADKIEAHDLAPESAPFTSFFA